MQGVRDGATEVKVKSSSVEEKPLVMNKMTYGVKLGSFGVNCRSSGVKKRPYGVKVGSYGVNYRADGYEVRAFYLWLILVFVFVILLFLYKKHYGTKWISKGSGGNWVSAFRGFD